MIILLSLGDLRLTIHRKPALKLIPLSVLLRLCRCDVKTWYSVKNRKMLPNQNKAMIKVFRQEKERKRLSQNVISKQTDIVIFVRLSVRSLSLHLGLTHTTKINIPI